MDTKEKQKLKQFVGRLAQYRGRHTELVSVYIPAGYDLNKIIQHLLQEQGTAANIKDKTTRNHVIDSLERMVRFLRLVNRTPTNGLAVFSGNISEREGQADIQVFSIEPPKEIKIRLYRCDQTFILDVLREMLEHNEVYGLLVIDRREGNIGLLKGTSIVELAGFTSDVPGKTTKGGQCIDCESLVLMADNSTKKIKYLKKGDLIKSYNFKTMQLENSFILNKWKSKKNGLLIKTKTREIISSKDHTFFVISHDLLLEVYAENLNIGDYLIDKDMNPIEINSIEKLTPAVDMIDISVENKNFIANDLVVHNSQQRYARLRDIAAAEFFKKVAETANKEFLEMKNLKGILVGGPGPTKEDFLNGPYLNNELKRKILGIKDLGYTGEEGLRELVTKSQDLLAQEAITQEKQVMEEFFKLLNTDDAKVTYGEEDTWKALQASAVKTLLISEQFDATKANTFETKAEETGAEVKYVSLDTREGAQLAELGGVAALLRFAIH